MGSLDIGVAGAGIGGLALASLLADRGHRVTVFDRFERPAPVGSGLVIQPVGQAVLDRIGLGVSARAEGAPVWRMLGHEADHGRRVLDVVYGPGGGARYGLGIHRASLFDLLLAAAEARRVDLRSGCAVAGARDGVLRLADGKDERFDLVVDATGAGSPIAPLEARALPFGAVWGTVDWVPDVLPEGQLTQRYRRADRMAGVLPCGRGKAAIFWSLPVGAYDGWRQAGLVRWREEIAALWPEALPFFEQVGGVDQMTMARYGHGTLRRPYASRLAIIGDAAHRASPQLGQGANMALLDAWALALALEGRPVAEALRVYGQARRWHVRAYQAMSRAFTPQYQSDSRVLPWLRDRVLFPVSRVPPVPRILTALVCGTMLPPLGSLEPRETALADRPA
ncbi:FAD-dependent oxidoreductase [Aestuariibius sp. 2305UL40-4]|uniref:FAD-dependent oxidoreductase n=1 Tax=Aestuariibius violaceus TaxID=3234132 RepID=UPI00345EF758